MKKIRFVVIAAALAAALTIVSCAKSDGVGGESESSSGTATTGEAGAAGSTAVDETTSDGGVSDNAATVEFDALTVLLRRADETTALFSAADPSASTPTFSSGDADALVICRPASDTSRVTLTLESAGGTDSRELTFENGVCEIPTATLERGSYSLSLTVSDAARENITYYVSTRASFVNAVGSVGNVGSANDAGGAGISETVAMIADIDASGADTVVTAPFTWATNGFSFRSDGAVVFSPSAETGAETDRKMTILNGDGDIDAEVVCDAPLWDFEISSVFGNFAEKRPFYVYARTINGGVVDCSEAYVDSIDDWNALSDRLSSGTLPTHVRRVVCEGAFSLPPLTVTRELSFEFAGKVDIDGDGALAFEVSAWGALAVDTSRNAADLSDKITFETPSCDVVWDGDDAPTFEYAEMFMNVRSYNGARTDDRLGGTGKAAIRKCTITDKKSGFSATVAPTGNSFELTLGYVDSLDLKNAELTLDLTSDGEGSLVSDGGAWYCVVKDADGNTRGYRVDVKNERHKLPVISISTNGAGITSKEVYVAGTFSIDYVGVYDFDNISDAPMKVRGRGNSSWKLDKKPYKIKFESKTSLFGLHKAKKWLLIANHVDRSFIRNRLAYSIGDVLDNLVFVPRAYPVDLFVDGKYCGVYQLSEEIEVERGRVPGEENSTEVDTDYLLEIGGDIVETSFGENNFTHKLFRYVEIKNPDVDVLTEEQFKFVSDYVKSVEEAIINGEDYAELLDVPSLVDWFLLYEFSYNVDGIFRRSDFLLKQKGGKLFFCSPWDFDYAFGNMGLDSDDYAEWICLGNKKTDDYDMYIPKNIIDYLIEDEYFISQLKARWAEVGKKMLEVGLETVDDAEENISPSADENFAVWKILGTKIQFEKKATAKLQSYSAHLDYLRDFMRSRYAWMDKTIGNM